MGVGDRLVIPTVVNKRTDEYDVYIGRGSIWGNPHRSSSESSRTLTISKYRTHLKIMVATGQITDEDLKSLSGKRLGCYCKPKPCHGDLIVEFFKEHFQISE